MSFNKSSTPKTTPAKSSVADYTFSRRRSFARSGKPLQLTKHLTANDDFVRLSAHINHLRSMQNTLETMLPVDLLSGARVSNYRKGRLTIHTSSGLVAVKLRQMSQRFIDGFNKSDNRGGGVTGIKIIVQPHSGHPGILPTTHGNSTQNNSPKSLDLQSKLRLLNLANNLPKHSTLKQALLRLTATTDE